MGIEIERKFLMDGFPPLVPERVAQVEQGYLATEPVVRIRRSEENGVARYKMCIKGKGTLVRKEIEIDIPEEQYRELCELLPAPPVKKDFRVYRLPGGELLECSHVDPGEALSFFYAEVEFPDIASAQTFVPPVFLGEEVTETPGYTMKDYWNRKIAFQKIPLDNPEKQE